MKKLLTIFLLLFIFSVQSISAIGGLEKYVISDERDDGEKRHLYRKKFNHKKFIDDLITAIGYAQKDFEFFSDEFSGRDCSYYNYEFEYEAYEVSDSLFSQFQNPELVIWDQKTSGRDLDAQVYVSKEVVHKFSENGTDLFESWLMKRIKAKLGSSWNHKYIPNPTDNPYVIMTNYKKLINGKVSFTIYAWETEDNEAYYIDVSIDKDP